MYIINFSATDYWLGGRDDVIEGTWQWSSTDSVFTYNDWYPGEPSNSYNGEDCLELNARFHWKWNDSNCTIAQPFICEKRYAVNKSVDIKVSAYDALLIYLICPAFLYDAVIILGKVITNSVSE